MDQYIKYDTQFIILDSKFLKSRLSPYVTHSPNNPSKYDSEREFLMNHAIIYPAYEYVPLYEKYKESINWTKLFQQLRYDDKWALQLLINHSHGLDWTVVMEYLCCFGFDWGLELLIQRSTQPLTNEEHVEDIDKTMPLMLARPDLLNWDLMMQHPCKEYMSIFEKYPERIIWDRLSIKPFMRHFVRKNWKLINCNKIVFNDFHSYDDNYDWIVQILFIRAEELTDDTWSTLLRHSWLWYLLWPLFKEYPNRFKFPPVEHKNVDYLYAHFNLKEIVFTYDYEGIKKSKFDINNQIIGYFYRPSEIEKWLEDGNELEDFDPTIM